METISEDIGSEGLDQIETITPPPDLLSQNQNNVTPKHGSGMQQFGAQHKTPNVIEIITPG